MKVDLPGVGSAKVSHLTVTHETFWDQRFELHEKVSNSGRIYENMTPEQRTALAERTRRGLAVMYDNVEAWLPDALALDETGQMIRVELNFMAAEIDKDVLLAEQATTFEIEELKNQLREEVP
jgi:hypothetical protein